MLGLLVALLVIVGCHIQRRLGPGTAVGFDLRPRREREPRELHRTCRARGSCAHAQIRRGRSDDHAAAERLRPQRLREARRTGRDRLDGGRDVPRRRPLRPGTTPRPDSSRTTNGRRAGPTGTSPRPSSPASRQAPGIHTLCASPGFARRAGGSSRSTTTSSITSTFPARFGGFRCRGRCSMQATRTETSTAAHSASPMSALCQQEGKPGRVSRTARRGCTPTIPKYTYVDLGTTGFIAKNR